MADDLQTYITKERERLERALPSKREMAASNHPELRQGGATFVRKYERELDVLSAAQDGLDLLTLHPMDTAPRDGTLLILWIGADDDRANPLEDSEHATPTIGFNHFDDNGLDEWQFAGWDWNGDDFDKGRGTPIAWSRFPHRRTTRDHGTNVLQKAERT